MIVPIRVDRQSIGSSFSPECIYILYILLHFFLDNQLFQPRLIGNMCLHFFFFFFAEMYLEACISNESMLNCLLVVIILWALKSDMNEK